LYLAEVNYKKHKRAEEKEQGQKLLSLRIPTTSGHHSRCLSLFFVYSWSIFSLSPTFCRRLYPFDLLKLSYSRQNFVFFTIWGLRGEYIRYFNSQTNSLVLQSTRHRIWSRCSSRSWRAAICIQAVNLSTCS
jgi:hypothetical protein